MSILLAWGSVEDGQFDHHEGKGEQKSSLFISYFYDRNIVVSQISCGSRHTLVLTNSGQVFSFGWPKDGALGRFVGSCQTPGQVELPVKNIHMVSAGSLHSVAFGDEGCFIWGTFGSIILQGRAVPIDFPKKIENSAFENKGLCKVVSGNHHTLMLTENSAFLLAEKPGIHNGISWENAKLSAFGLFIERVPLNYVHDVFAGGDQCFALVKKPLNCPKISRSESMHQQDGDLLFYAWGSNSYNQLPIDDPLKQKFLVKPELVEDIKGSDVLQVTSGEYHSLVLMKDGRLIGIGMNIDGQVGTDVTGNCPQMFEKLTEIKIPGKIKWIASSSHFNFAQNMDGEVFSWGLGSSYVLGNNEEVILKEPRRVETGFLMDRRGLACLGANFVIFGEGLEPPKKVQLQSNKGKTSTSKNFFLRRKNNTNSSIKKSKRSCSKYEYPLSKETTISKMDDLSEDKHNSNYMRTSKDSSLLKRFSNIDDDLFLRTCVKMKPEGPFIITS